MKITGITTYAVGNRWKNWLFVRVDTDEGIHGVGEGSLNGFCRTVEAAVHELEPMVIGRDPFATESLVLHLARDLYSEGGQIHGAAIAAIEVACWDIKGKALGVPIYELLGGLVRERVPVYANGWYQVERSPDAFARAAVDVVAMGYRALKFDPFGAVWRTQTRRDQDESIDIVAAVRDAVGSNVDLMIEGHNRFSPSTAIAISTRLAEYRPAWFEEPVPHQNVAAMVHVARCSDVPIATGESLSSVQQFGDLLSHGAVDIVQPEPVSLGGLGRTKIVAGLADAHYGMVAPHNAQGPVCSMVSLHLGASTTNFYYLESFEDFNESWTREIVIGNALGRLGWVCGSEPRAWPRCRPRLGCAVGPSVPTRARAAPPPRRLGATGAAGTRRVTMSDPNDLSVLPSAGSPRRRTLLHHEAVTDLGIAIVSGELPEGVPLPIESELGKRLGVSRTVVREATKVLASKGLLRSRPKVGTVPLPRVSWDVLDPEVLGWMLDYGPIADVIRDVSEVRLIIEPAAARLAAIRRSEEEAERLRILTDDLVGSADDDERYVVTDLDFHAAILSATKNATLVRLTGAIGAALRASRRVTVHAPGGPQSAMAEHEAVARAVIDGDADRAYERMTELIVLTQSHIEWVLAHDDPSSRSTKT